MEAQSCAAEIARLGGAVPRMEERVRSEPDGSRTRDELRLPLIRGDLNRAPVVAEFRFCGDEKPSVRNRRSCIRTPRCVGMLTVTVFPARMRFSSVRKTRLARAARNGCSSTTRRYTRADRTAAVRLARTAIRPRGSPIAHGREACPHAIGDLLENHHAVFVVIRTENAVGARERASPFVACGGI